MATSNLYRLAGPSTWFALVALVLSGIALALFFGGAGSFWGPINDGLIVLTAIALIPAVLAVGRVAEGHLSPWLPILTILTIAGLVLIAVGQTLLIVGALSLDGSYVTGGVGVLPLLAWMILLAVLSLGEHALPSAIGWAAVATLAAIAATSVVGVVTQGPALWVASIVLLIALAAWLASLASSFGSTATTA